MPAGNRYLLLAPAEATDKNMELAREMVADPRGDRLRSYNGVLGKKVETLTRKWNQGFTKVDG